MQESEQGLTRPYCPFVQSQKCRKGNFVERESGPGHGQHQPVNCFHCFRFPLRCGMRRGAHGPRHTCAATTPELLHSLPPFSQMKRADSERTQRCVSPRKPDVIPLQVLVPIQKHVPSLSYSLVFAGCRTVLVVRNVQNSTKQSKANLCLSVK